MLKSLPLITSASLLIVTLTGCATIERGPRQRILVVSEPSGAAISTEHCGLPDRTGVSTPSTISVNRRSADCTITVSRPGYRSASARLVRQFDPYSDAGIHYQIPFGPNLVGPVLFWGSLVLGGIVVDTVTGAAFVIEPDTLSFRLYPEDDLSTTQDGGRSPGYHDSPSSSRDHMAQDR